MLESTHKHSHLNSGTIFLSALLQGKLYKNFVENSLSPTQWIMDQNNIFLMPRERTSMWTIWFPPTTSKISLWTFLDRSHTFWIFFGIDFSCFLCIKLIVDLIVMILRQMEIHRLTGASPKFGKTLLSASYKLFSTLTSTLTSVFNPQAPLLQALEPEPTSTKIKDETREPVDENKKKEEHHYPIVYHPSVALAHVWLG